MQIREFSITDYEAVRRIWTEAGITMKTSDDLLELLKKLERDSELFLVADEAGAVIGTVMGGWDGRRGWIYHLAVSPAHQKRGTGRLLVEEVERRLRDYGALKINLTLESRNQDAIAFYRRMGYKVDDLIVMSKDAED